MEWRGSDVARGPGKSLGLHRVRIVGAASRGKGIVKVVEADPARRSGLLAGLWTALRLDGWRRVAIGLLPLTVALMLGVAHDRGWTRWSDAAAFDIMTLDAPGRPPAVVIIDSDREFEARGTGRHAELVQAALALGATRVAFRLDPGLDIARDGFASGKVIVARPVSKVPGKPVWQLTKPPPNPGITSGARVLAAAERGLHRAQLMALPGSPGPIPLFETAAAGREPIGEPYWLRLTRRQNLPRFEASQVLSGEAIEAALKGMVVLVEPPQAARPVTVASPRDVPGSVGTLTDYNALAIQTLIDRREVRSLGTAQSALLLVLFALVSGLIYLRSDPKRIMPLLLLASLTAIGAGTWLALEYAGVLLPVTALVLAQPLAALLVLHRAELSEDRNLRRFVTQTINLSSHQVLLKDLGRMSQFLAESATGLGIDQSLLFEVRGNQLLVLESSYALSDEALGDRRRLRALLRRARRASVPIDAAALVPDWPGAAWLAALGPAQGEVYWLYGVPEGQSVTRALSTAASLAADYRAMQQLRADLSAGADRRRSYRPADEWAGGAVKLIAGHGEQVSTGLDRLETAVMVFHPIGFPIHANAAMGNLFGQLDLSLTETTLPSLLKALTRLDQARIDAAVRDLLLHGGEMRVDAREIDTRSRQLRVAVAREAAGGRPLALVVEAIDVSELRRLAQLRLNLSGLVDVSIRNDLDAIGFALAAAGSGRLDALRIARAHGQIGQAVGRATERLDALTPHLHPVPGDARGECFPLDAAVIVEEACGRVAALARELSVTIKASRPSISGFTIADPRLLADMVEAMIRIVLADSPPGEAIVLDVTELEGKTRLSVSGGVGMAFERLYAALEAPADKAPGPFRAIVEGMAAAVTWGAVVSYSSRVGKGYRFTIEMRRIG